MGAQTNLDCVSGVRLTLNLLNAANARVVAKRTFKTAITVSLRSYQALQELGKEGRGGEGKGRGGEGKGGEGRGRERGGEGKGGGKETDLLSTDRWKRARGRQVMH